MPNQFDFTNDDLFREFDLDPSFGEIETNPTKVSKVANTIKDLVKEAAPELMKGVRDALSRQIPGARDAINESIATVDDFQRLREDISRELYPALNRTRMVALKVLPKAKDLLPKTLYAKLNDKLAKGITEEYRFPSEEERKAEQEKYTVEQTLEKIFIKQRELEKEKILNDSANTIFERHFDSIRFKETTKNLSILGDSLQNIRGFLTGTFTDYLKKDIELTYQHIFIAKDTFNLVKLFNANVDRKLEELKHNTAMPDSYKLKNFKQDKTKDNVKSSEKANDYLQNFRANLMKNVRDAVMNPIKTLTEFILPSLESYVDISNMMGEEQFSPTQVIGKGLGWLGRLKLDNKVTRFARDNRSGFHILDLLTSNLKSRLTLDVTNFANRHRGDLGLSGFLSNLVPRLEPNTTTVKNEMLESPTEAATFDNLTRQSIVEIIPSHLAFIAKYVKSLTQTLIPNVVPEDLSYNLRQRTITTATESGVDFLKAKGVNEKAINVNNEEAIQTVQRASLLAKKVSISTKEGKEVIKKVSDIDKDLITFFTNSGFYRKPLDIDELLAYLNKAPLENPGYISSVLEGIEDPRGFVASLIATITDDKSQKIDPLALAAIENAVIRHMSKINITDYIEDANNIYGLTGAIRSLGITDETGNIKTEGIRDFYRKRDDNKITYYKDGREMSEEEMKARGLSYNRLDYETREDFESIESIQKLLARLKATDPTDPRIAMLESNNPVFVAAALMMGDPTSPLHKGILDLGNAANTAFEKGKVYYQEGKEFIRDVKESLGAFDYKSFFSSSDTDVYYVVKVIRTAPSKFTITATNGVKSLSYEVETAETYTAGTFPSNEQLQKIIAKRKWILKPGVDIIYGDAAGATTVKEKATVSEGTGTIFDKLGAFSGLDFLRPVPEQLNNILHAIYEVNGVSYTKENEVKPAEQKVETSRVAPSEPHTTQEAPKSSAPTRPIPTVVLPPRSSPTTNETVKPADVPRQENTNPRPVIQVILHPEEATTQTPIEEPSASIPDRPPTVVIGPQVQRLTDIRSVSSIFHPVETEELFSQTREEIKDFKEKLGSLRDALPIRGLFLQHLPSDSIEQAKKLWDACIAKNASFAEFCERFKTEFCKDDPVVASCIDQMIQLASAITDPNEREALISDTLSRCAKLSSDMKDPQKRGEALNKLKDKFQAKLDALGGKEGTTVSDLIDQVRNSEEFKDVSSKLKSVKDQVKDGVSQALDILEQKEDKESEKRERKERRAKSKEPIITFSGGTGIDAFHDDFKIYATSVLTYLDDILVKIRKRGFVGSLLTGAGTAVSGVARGLGSVASGLYHGAGSILGAGLTGVSKLGSALLNSDLPSAIVTGGANLLGSGLTAAGNIASGLYRGVGSAVGGIARGIGSIGSGALNSIFGTGAMLGGFKNFVRRIGRPRYIDIYRKDNIEPGKPLLSAKQQEEGVYFADGKKVENSMDINAPVFTQVEGDDNPKTLISNEDLKVGLVDAQGRPLNERTELFKGGIGGFAGLALHGAGAIFGGLGTIYGAIAKALGITIKTTAKVGTTAIGRLFGIDTDGTVKYHSDVITRLDQLLEIMTGSYYMNYTSTQHAADVQEAKDKENDEKRLDAKEQEEMNRKAKAEMAAEVNMTSAAVNSNPNSPNSSGRNSSSSTSSNLTATDVAIGAAGGATATTLTGKAVRTAKNATESANRISQTRSAIKLRSTSVKLSKEADALLAKAAEAERSGNVVEAQKLFERAEQLTNKAAEARTKAKAAANTARTIKNTQNAKKVKQTAENKTKLSKRMIDKLSKLWKTRGGKWAMAVGALTALGTCAYVYFRKAKPDPKIEDMKLQMLQTFHNRLESSNISEAEKEDIRNALDEMSECTELEGIQGYAEAINATFISAEANLPEEQRAIEPSFQGVTTDTINHNAKLAATISFAQNQLQKATKSEDIQFWSDKLNELKEIQKDSLIETAKRADTKVYAANVTPERYDFIMKHNPDALAEFRQKMKEETAKTAPSANTNEYTVTTEHLGQIINVDGKTVVLTPENIDRYVGKVAVKSHTVEAFDNVDSYANTAVTLGLVSKGVPKVTNATKSTIKSISQSEKAAKISRDLALNKAAEKATKLAGTVSSSKIGTTAKAIAKPITTAGKPVVKLASKGAVALKKAAPWLMLSEGAYGTVRGLTMDEQERKEFIQERGKGTFGGGRFLDGTGFKKNMKNLSDVYKEKGAVSAIGRGFRMATNDVAGLFDFVEHGKTIGAAVRESFATADAVSSAKKSAKKNQEAITLKDGTVVQGSELYLKARLQQLHKPHVQKMLGKSLCDMIEEKLNRAYLVLGAPDNDTGRAWANAIVELIYFKNDKNDALQRINAILDKIHAELDPYDMVFDHMEGLLTQAKQELMPSSTTKTSKEDVFSYGKFNLTSDELEDSKEKYVNANVVREHLTRKYGEEFTSLPVQKQTEAITAIANTYAPYQMSNYRTRSLASKLGLKDKLSSRVLAAKSVESKTQMALSNPVRSIQTNTERITGEYADVIKPREIKDSSIVKSYAETKIPIIKQDSDNQEWLKKFTAQNQDGIERQNELLERLCQLVALNVDATNQAGEGFTRRINRSSEQVLGTAIQYTNKIGEELAPSRPVSRPRATAVNVNKRSATA